MFPAPFEYYRAGSVAEAARLLRERPGAKLLAGGQSLLPLMKLRLARPPALIDIGRVPELRGIALRDGRVHIGALTTHAELARSELLRQHCPVLPEAAALIGDPQVRNRGTIGGNVAHADPASDLPTVLTALEARFLLLGPAGERDLSPGEFFQGPLTTALAEEEVLTAVEVPVRGPGQGMAYVKFPHPASRYAVIGVAAVVTVEGGKLASARVALGGLVPRPTRAPSVERALAGQAPTPEALQRAAEQVGQDLGDEVLSDTFASADYRRAMAPVYVRRALSAALQRAV